MKGLTILASVFLAYSASSVAAELTAEVPTGDAEFTAKAMTAAPAAIGKDATIIRIGDGFKVTTIKSGTNGWTCAVDTNGEPFCADAAALEWWKAISTKADPPDKTGFAYMLAGDLGTSNHDPYAMDKTHWVHTGPHVMIVGKAGQEMAAYYPNGMDPDPAHPYVMYPGTKYQHVMLPADMVGQH